MNAVMSTDPNAVMSLTLNAAVKPRSQRLRKGTLLEAETETSHFNNLILVNNNNL